MSAVLMWSLVAPKLSVDSIMDDWVAGCGNIIAASIPVLVNSKAPLLGRPPNCFTEHANFTCWNFSVYNELSFFSEFKQIYNEICRNLHDVRGRTFFPEWKNTAANMCSPWNVVVNAKCQSLSRCSLLRYIRTWPFSSPINNRSPVKSHCSTVTMELLDKTLRKCYEH